MYATESEHLAITARISICIATYRRSARLALLLEDLAAQTLTPMEIIVVDNDAQASARNVVDKFERNTPTIAINFGTQSEERNIATTRNVSVSMASGDWLAFIDDDERAPPTWLAQLHETARNAAADAVLGPVTPLVPEHAPDWIKRGQFYNFARSNTGALVAANLLRFGNILIRAEPLRALDGPFDTNYGLKTGEDGDLLLRMREEGAKIVWCDEAEVTEPVESARLKLQWLLQRAFSGGQEYARKRLAGRYGNVGLLPNTLFFADGVLKLFLALLLVPLTLPIGRHRSAHWLIRANANFGKLTVYFGWEYSEYAKGSAPSPE